MRIRLSGIWWTRASWKRQRPRQIRTSTYTKLQRPVHRRLSFKRCRRWISNLKSVFKEGNGRVSTTEGCYHTAGHEHSSGSRSVHVLAPPSCRRERHWTDQFLASLTVQRESGGGSNGDSVARNRVGVHTSELV